MLRAMKGLNLAMTISRASRRSMISRYLSSDASRLRKPSKQDFDYCIDLVQSRDRESYLCGLLMPHESRRAYFSIRAFNVELASIKDGSISRQIGGAQFEESGASMALKLRIQWWRDALNQIYGDGLSQDELKDSFAASMASSTWNNPIVRALDHAVQNGQLTRRFLERLIEARESDLDIKQPETLDDIVYYAENVSSSLLYLSLETTNIREEQADLVAYHAGIAVGLLTALRGARFRLVRGECGIPRELIPQQFPYHKFNTEDPSAALDDVEKKMLQEAVYEIARKASNHLEEARELQCEVPKRGRPCFLPVVPSMQYLAKLEKTGYDIFDNTLQQPDQLKMLAFIGRTWLTGVF